MAFAHMGLVQNSECAQMGVVWPIYESRSHLGNLISTLLGILPTTSSYPSSHSSVGAGVVEELGWEDCRKNLLISLRVLQEFFASYEGTSWYWHGSNPPLTRTADSAAFSGGVTADIESEMNFGSLSSPVRDILCIQHPILNHFTEKMVLLYPGIGRRAFGLWWRLSLIVSCCRKPVLETWHIQRVDKWRRSRKPGISIGFRGEDSKMCFSWLTSLIAPWLQIVMAGNSMSLIGFPVLETVVKTGFSCHS